MQLAACLLSIPVLSLWIEASALPLQRPTHHDHHGAGQLGEAEDTAEGESVDDELLESDFIVFAPAVQVRERMAEDKPSRKHKHRKKHEDFPHGQVGPYSFDCSNDYLMVFSLGKTGTSTFHESLRHLCGFGAPYVDHTRKHYKQGIKPQKNVDVAKDFLSKLPEGHRVWVVAAVRNPFERLMSMYFQVLGNKITNVRKELPKFHYQLDHGYCEDGKVFFNHFQKLLGINLLKEQFDYAHKRLVTWGQVNHGKNDVKVLLLRTEDIGSWPHVLRSLFPGFSLHSTNEGDSKSYAKTYAEFKKQFKYSKEEVKCIKKSPAFHFYKKAEVAQMMDVPTMRGSPTVVKGAGLPGTKYHDEPDD